MRNISSVAAVTQGSNRVVSTTQDNWKGIKNGSSIKFGNQHAFYEITKTNQLLYVKEFTVEDIMLRIPHNKEVGMLVPNDTVSIVAKQSNVTTIVKILNGGKQYKKDDILDLNGGIPSTDVVTGFDDVAKVKVARVSDTGAIEQAVLIDHGKYLQTPDDVCEMTGGHGNNAVIKFQYSPVDQRIVIERSVKRIQPQSTFFNIELNTPIPKGINGGEISVTKWELFLSANYAGNTDPSISYEIIVNCFPDSNIPIMAQDSINPTQILYLAMRRLIKRISALEEEVKLLKEDFN